MLSEYLPTLSETRGEQNAVPGINHGVDLRSQVSKFHLNPGPPLEIWNVLEDRLRNSVMEPGVGGPDQIRSPTADCYSSDAADRLSRIQPL
jgi:hypothetical protein